MGAHGIWEHCARERARDVTALWGQGQCHGAIYMAGYVVECRLKELLQRSGKSFPPSGRAGHDLQSHWEAAGFKVRDLHGNSRLFIETWSTNQRYKLTSTSVDYQALHGGAIALSGFLQNRINRINRR